MGGLGRCWGMRPVAENENSAERCEREACEPRQELKWTLYSYFKLGLLGRRGCCPSGREAYPCNRRLGASGDGFPSRALMKRAPLEERSEADCLATSSRPSK